TRVAVEILIEAKDFYRALSYIRNDEPEYRVLKAGALHGAGLGEQAKEVYESAVEANPALEDPELRSLFRPPEAPRAPARNEANAFDGGTQPREDEKNGEPTRIESPVRSTQSSVNFSEVGGLEGVKKEIRRKIINPFLKPQLFQKFRKRSG